MAARSFVKPYPRTCISRWTRSITVHAPDIQAMHSLGSILSKTCHLRTFNMAEQYPGAGYWMPLSPKWCMLLRLVTANSLQTLSITVRWASEDGNSCFTDLYHFTRLRKLAVNFFNNREHAVVTFDTLPWVFPHLVALKITHFMADVMASHLEKLWCFLARCDLPRLSSFAMDFQIQRVDREVDTDYVKQFFDRQPEIVEVDLKFDGDAIPALIRFVLPCLKAPQVRLSLRTTPLRVERLVFPAPSTLTELELKVELLTGGIKESTFDLFNVLFPEDAPSPVPSLRTVLIKYIYHQTRFTWTGKGPRRYEYWHACLVARLAEYAVRLQKYGVEIEDEDGAQCRIVPKASP
jgi:hypothetical protein